jgi:DNA-binding NarL/FixJ family response regulator
MRFLVADYHDLVRESIAAILNNNDATNVALAGTLTDALDLMVQDTSFDLVLLDYDMPGMNGLEGLARMIEVAGDQPVALLSGFASREIAVKAIEIGAAGFVPKTLSSRSMITAVKFMAAGEVYAPVDFMQNRGQEHDSILGTRETEVLRGICEGKSNKEIAIDLGLQEVTIKLHVKTLSRKLGARNRTHAAMIGRDRALI